MTPIYTIHELDSLQKFVHTTNCIDLHICIQSTILNTIYMQIYIKFYNIGFHLKIKKYI